MAMQESSNEEMFWNTMQFIVIVDIKIFGNIVCFIDVEQI